MWVQYLLDEQRERFGPTAGFCRYDDLRTSAGDVGQVEICVDASAVEPGLRCMVRGEEGHWRRSVLGGVKGPVRRSEFSRSGATLTRLGSGVAFPAAIYAVACIKLRDGRPRATLPHVAIPKLRPEAAKVLGRSARMVWRRLRALDLGDWRRFGSHSCACL